MRLQLYRLVLQFLEFLLELVLNVEVVIGHLGLLSCVLVVQVIQFVHLEIEVLQSHLQRTDLLLMPLYGRIQSKFLLLENGLLGSQIVTVP